MFDVLIIGAGVVGSAAARELSRYRLRIAVLEKTPDVCCETSARNSGVLHAGFNNRPGSRMAKFCVEGNRGFDQLARELDIPYKRTGKLVVGFTEEDCVEQMALAGSAVSVPISGGNGSNRLDVFSSTSTLWLMFPMNTMDADAAFSSLPRAKEPEAI